MGVGEVGADRRGVRTEWEGESSGFRPVLRCAAMGSRPLDRRV